MADLNDKVKSSIDLLIKLEKKGDTYNLGFSGGKDSIVILELAKRSGVKFNPTYSNTTIDPHIGFIRKYYPEVTIIQPEKTFYQLIAEKGLPTRVGRFCCEYLKERYGIGKRNVDGTRWQESSKRSKYSPEDCDTRKWMKGATHIRPILNWTEKEVWQFIKENNLPYPKFYDPPYNFKRLGCIGCPMAGVKHQMYEFRLFPQVALAIIKAIRKNIDNKPNNTFARNFINEYEVFHWWLSGLSIDNYIAFRSVSLFPINNHKELIISALYKK